jgi:hypothetical protein
MSDSTRYEPAIPPGVCASETVAGGYGSEHTDLSIHGALREAQALDRQGPTFRPVSVPADKGATSRDLSHDCQRSPTVVYAPAGIKSASTRLAANRGSPTVAHAMRPRWGKANKKKTDV